MGWYDANPSTSNDLPPEAAAKKYVEYMGGADAVLEQGARRTSTRASTAGWPRRLKHVVFANPDNVEAKDLLADTYEQLGYQAESGPWRAVYLQGAYRAAQWRADGWRHNTASPDTISAMPPEMLFDYLARAPQRRKAAGKKITLNVKFTDLKQDYALNVENGVLNYWRSRSPNADASLTLDQGDARRDPARRSHARGGDRLGRHQGRRQARRRSAEFFGLLDTFPFWFNIVTP